MANSKTTDDLNASELALKGKGMPAPEDAIGRRIRDRREELQLNVSQLSERTKEVSGDGKGLSRAVIAGYENGEYKPGTRELRILCSTLGTSPNWMVFGREQLSKQAASIEILIDDDLPQMGVAKLLYILTSLPEDEFNAVATLLIALAKKDKAIRAGLSDDAEVMGRMIVASMALESSQRWGAHISDHLDKSAKKAKNMVTKPANKNGAKRS